MLEKSPPPGLQAGSYHENKGNDDEQASQRTGTFLLTIRRQGSSRRRAVVRRLRQSSLRGAAGASEPRSNPGTFG